MENQTKKELEKLKHKRLELEYNLLIQQAWQKESKIKKRTFSLKILLVFILVLLVLVAVDFVSKYFLFDKNNAMKGNAQHVYNFKDIFEIKSVVQDKSFIFNVINVSIPYWANIIINIGLALLFLVPVLLSGRFITSIFIAFIISGLIGNSIDRFMMSSGISVNGVVHEYFIMKWLILPWMNNWTVNLADIFIVIGSMLLIINLLFSLFTTKRKQKNSYTFK